MPTPVDTSTLFRDGLIGLSMLFVAELGYAVVEGGTAIGPAVGMVGLTAASAVVAYRHGKQFGDVDLP